MPPLQYIWANIAIWMMQFDVGGTPADIPWSGAWDGSLWTLGWELLCYLGVLIAGVGGLLKSSRTRSWVIVGLFIASWFAVLLKTVTEVHWTVAFGSRFALMFMAGAAIYQFRHRIPCSYPYVLVAMVITVLSMWLPDYRLVGGITWAYVVLAVGVLVKVSWLRFERWDVSYGVYIYAFPIQQLLVIAGLASLPVLIFGIVATVPTLVVALISFLAVERPALRLKKRLNARPETTRSADPAPR
ncbi:hypothetical protein TPAU25S_00208 [Tsukamurella paurometabola]|uniref:acyltransferase family protein n=1 Tax=Tsukamurella paurometabola TaxID=2061 RepID=UPI00019F01E2|nr:hypothetical protein [Tsukamurella paurometabola]SUP38103.1 Uncharacterised protein [Tsukamurella paurometabola]